MITDGKFLGTGQRTIQSCFIPFQFSDRDTICLYLGNRQRKNRLALVDITRIEGHHTMMGGKGKVAIVQLHSIILRTGILQ